MNHSSIKSKHMLRAGLSICTSWTWLFNTALHFEGFAQISSSKMIHKGKACKNSCLYFINGIFQPFHKNEKSFQQKKSLISQIVVLVFL